MTESTQQGTQTAVHRQRYEDDFNAPVPTGVCRCGAPWTAEHVAEVEGPMLPDVLAARIAATDGEVHKPFDDDGVTYCGWATGRATVVDGCGQVWPCVTVRARRNQAAGIPQATPAPRTWVITRIPADVMAVRDDGGVTWRRYGLRRDKWEAPGRDECTGMELLMTRGRLTEVVDGRG